MTGWSEDRVAILKKCWADGLSASQCASRLGGVSRCAVIGKVHRLGLPGRATTSSKAARRRTQRAEEGVPLRPKMPARQLRFLAGRAAFFVAPPPAVILTWQAAEPDTATPAGPGVALLDLLEHECRWPQGDPREDGFRFCGCERVPGYSYCERHVVAGTQPPRFRRRT